jgi:hypothetical protein
LLFSDSRLAYYWEEKGKILLVRYNHTHTFILIEHAIIYENAFFKKIAFSKEKTTLS